MMDCLFAKCKYFIYFAVYLCIFKGVPCVTDCVLAELEKLGQQYRIALQVGMYETTL